MYGKIEITGIIESCTGMHIGGSTQFAAIGAVDAPIVRDALSDKPMIPGSSLKGKMRALLAKYFNDERMPVKTADDDNIRIQRLFGSARGRKRSRLLFSDMVLSNMDELKANGHNSATEIKFENAINRGNSIAVPRQVERSIRGSQYQMSIIYDAEKAQDIQEDFETFAIGLELLEADYLGGNGTRGYGRIKFKELDAKVVFGTISETVLEECKLILKEVVQ